VHQPFAPCAGKFEPIFDDGDFAFAVAQPRFELKVPS